MTTITMMMTTVASSHLTPQLDSKEASMALRHLAGSLVLAAALHICLPRQVADSLQAEVAQSMLNLLPSIFRQSAVRALHASSEPEPVAAEPVPSQSVAIFAMSRSWLTFSILGRATDLAETAAMRRARTI